jgi:hypothetical protein
VEKSTKQRLDVLLSEAAEIIQTAHDSDIPELLGNGVTDAFLKAIAKPKQDKEQGIYDYLLANKYRLQLLAIMRLAIQANYSIKGKIEGTGADVYVSPNHIQWYEDGVMFLQGEKQFEGLIGLYQGGRVQFAVSKRDMRGGESIGPEALDFVDVEEMQDRTQQPSVPQTTDALKEAITRLQRLLRQEQHDEGAYQKYLTRHPWVFGAQYKQIDSHKALDDENIPDFTGVRVRDSARDIIEIKPPSLPLFKGQKSFRAEFNDAWNQTERYLDFARNQSDYLMRQKGLFFDNPKCYLLAGYNLTEAQLRELRRKERMNPAITILTYNDLLAMAKSTVVFVRALKQ